MKIKIFHFRIYFHLADGDWARDLKMEASLMCSSRIAITSLNCDPGGLVIKSEYYNSQSTAQSSPEP